MRASWRRSPGTIRRCKLGPPWWFYDSPEGMRRFRELTTETAGFYNTVGFNDDTRAFLSIPARHDVARRIDCGYLARLVAEHRLDEDEAHELARRPRLPPGQGGLQAVTERLSTAMLAKLRARRSRGRGYDARGAGRGVVHLGIGAFHRAHQAVVSRRSPRAATGAGASSASRCARRRCATRWRRRTGSTRWSSATATGERAADHRRRSSACWWRPRRPHEVVAAHGGAVGPASSR